MWSTLEFFVFSCPSLLSIIYHVLVHLTRSSLLLFPKFPPFNWYVKICTAFYLIKYCQTCLIACSMQNFTMARSWIFQRKVNTKPIICQYCWLSYPTKQLSPPSRTVETLTLSKFNDQYCFPPSITTVLWQVTKPNVVTILNSWDKDNQCFTKRHPKCVVYPGTGQN